METRASLRMTFWWHTICIAVLTESWQNIQDWHDLVRYLCIFYVYSNTRKNSWALFQFLKNLKDRTIYDANCLSLWYSSGGFGWTYTENKARFEGISSNYKMISLNGACKNQGLPSIFSGIFPRKLYVSLGQISPWFKGYTGLGFPRSSDLPVVVYRGCSEHMACHDVLMA